MEINHQANKLLVRQVAQEMRQRGVRIYRYSLGVNYTSQEQGEAQGVTTHLPKAKDPRTPITITSRVFQSPAAFTSVPDRERVELVVDHEFIHRVHGLRAHQKRAFPFSHEGLLGRSAVEAIAYGVQDREEYINSKKNRWSPQGVRLAQQVAKAGLRKHLDPFRRLSQERGFSHFGQTVAKIEKETHDPEYLEALGIKTTPR